MEIANYFEVNVNLLDYFKIRVNPSFIFYRPKVNFSIETSRYKLKIASSFDELIEVFHFRQEVFFGKSEFIEYDVDAYDSSADHIIVTDIATDKICGTYRITSSKNTRRHYSELEFNLDTFLTRPGTKLELGRAAISAEHRNGNVLDLLWRGIGKYATETKADYLFGCSSVMTTSPDVTNEVFHYLKNNQMISTEYEVSTTPKYTFGFFKEKIAPHKIEQAKEIVPALLRSYINAGSKVCGAPAIDRDFGCIDFMTILKIDEMNPVYKKRYFGKAQ
jgi:putative hemolysin